MSSDIKSFASSVLVILGIRSLHKMACHAEEGTQIYTNALNLLTVCLSSSILAYLFIALPTHVHQ